MTSLPTGRRALALAATISLASALFVSMPAAASCLPLQLPLAEAADTVVLVGTVRGIDGIQTELDVNEWFMGTDPADAVVIVGGRDPDVITSADWTPAIGEEYVIVARPTVDGVLETDLCQQQIVTPELLAALHDTYGDPRSPPFASPAPSLSPTASDATGTPASFVPTGADASPGAS